MVKKDSSFRFREMPESLTDRLKLAREALVLVSRGTSERTAVSKIASANPQLNREKSPALALVIDTVARLDFLDRAVSSTLAGLAINAGCLSLLRLAAELILSESSYSRQDRVWALRKISQKDELPKLERLLGSLIANGPPDYSGLEGEENRIGFLTHNPAWWVSYCFYHFGRELGLSLLCPFVRPRYVRVNALQNRGRQSLPAELKKSSSPLVEVGHGIYKLEGSPSLISKYFQNGLFQVQDLASYLAVEAAQPSPGESVLDLCAAPGGKTANIAQLMKNRGKILAVDYSPSRMTSWTHETKRLGVKIASPLVQDASNLGINGEFDLVLLDPPCSGTGILDRNPRMKWHLSSKLVKKFSQLQSKMLEEASLHARKGGRVLYCTCSMTLEENELVVSKFLVDHPDFETRPILQDHGSPGLRGLEDCRRFYPRRDGTAGYFVASLERIDAYS